MSETQRLSAAELARSLGEAQYQRGHRRCLDAAATLRTLATPHPASSSRWPDRAARAVDSGVRQGNRKVRDIAAALVDRAGRSS